MPRHWPFCLLLCLLVLVAGCTQTSKRPVPSASTGSGAASEWLTSPDGGRKLFHNPSLPMGRTAGQPAGRLTIAVDDTQRYQRFWGVGAALTGASAKLITGLTGRQRDQVLRSLFSPAEGIGLSVLRQPLGANDFSIGSATYDDSATADPGLRHFSLGNDAATVLPLVLRAQRINPSVTVVATPWSAPAWMKSNGALVGGTLKGQYYEAYARYLARAVRSYVAAGVPVAGLTVQNEPSFSPPGYPGMTLDAGQQAHLLSQFVKPALAAAGLDRVGLWALDDNYDRVADADQLVTDPAVRSAIAGVAFHCYHGDIAAMKDFHARHPGLALAISECTGGDWSPSFSGNLRYDVQSLLIEGIRNGASWVAKWNAALDPSGGPANGGCGNCRGVVTIDPRDGSVTFNEAYYAFGHIGKFVRPGAYVISSSPDSNGGIETVAFRNPDGSHVLLASNSGGQDTTFRVTNHGRSFDAALAAGAVATFTW